MLPLVAQRTGAGRAHVEVRRTTGANGHRDRRLHDARRNNDDDGLGVATHSTGAARCQRYRVGTGREILIHHIRGNGIRRSTIPETPMPIRNRAGTGVGEGDTQRRGAIRRGCRETRHRNQHARANHPVRREPAVASKDHRVREVAHRHRRKTDRSIGGAITRNRHNIRATTKEWGGDIRECSIQDTATNVGHDKADLVGCPDHHRAEVVRRRRHIQLPTNDR